jgi:DNA-directed RNA polymerase specialized sigma24 family protein
VPSQAKAYQSDLAFVRRILEGDETAARDLRRNYDTKISALLCARGAGRSEAEDLVADIWSDCFGGGGGKHSSLLKRYAGRCALESWLITVALNRFIGLRRRGHFRHSVTDQISGDHARPLDDVRFGSVACGETALTDLLLHCVGNAFSHCRKETLLMLKLVHIHDITQREIARTWRWHESKVCRVLDRARREIKNRVLKEMKLVDPWLKFTWDDFIELCAGSSSSSRIRQVLDNVQVPEAQQSKKGDY